MQTPDCPLCGKGLGELSRDPMDGRSFVHGACVGQPAQIFEARLPELPDGWRFDPDVATHDWARGIYWVILPDDTRTAWNAEDISCPVCAGDPEKMPDCTECKGRGAVDHVPYCDRPWDLVATSVKGGELWLGGIHCQFGGVAEGPGGVYESQHGNAFPEDRFDVVLSLTDQPGYEPTRGALHVYRIADADLDPVHHTKLDYLADRVRKDVHDGRKVLVRCQAGINRSALVVGLTMLKIRAMSVDEYLAHVREIRSPYVLMNRSFVRYLREVEARG